MADINSDESQITGLFLYTVFVASFGSGFQNGYNIVVLNTPRKCISQWIKISSFKDSDPKDVEYQITLIYSIAVSIYCIGGLVGAASTSSVIEYVGIKWGIVAANSFTFIGAFLAGFARWFDAYIFLIIGRFIIGINAGIGAGLAPMYMTAISPVSIRGAVGSCYQLFLTFGVLLGQVFGLHCLLGNQSWPYLFAVGAGVGISQTIFLIPCADSPEYLYGQGKVDEAREALAWLRGTNDVEDELEEIAQRKGEADIEGEVSLKSMFSKAEFRKPLIISCALIALKQLSGVNAMMPYSTSMFEAAKLADLAQYGSVILGVVNVIFTVVSMFIVDLVGRKILLVFSIGAMAFCTLSFFVSFVLAVEANMVWASYACILILALFFVFYAFGVGPIPWFIVSELFISQSARAKAESMAIASHWISYFIVGLTFCPLENWIGPFVFIMYFVMQIVYLIYVILQVPETKGKRMEEINAQFKS